MEGDRGREPGRIGGARETGVGRGWSGEVGVALRADWEARVKCNISKMLPSFINALEYYQKSSSENIDNFFYTTCLG